MTQQEIVAIATQAAIAAIQGVINAQNVQVSNPTKAQGARSKGKDKTKALPDATATTINDIVAGATKESVENGKTIEVPKDKAVLMEYSEKQLAIWGDTKARRDIIKKYGGEKTSKFGTIYGYKPEGVAEENLAKGWFMPKSKIEENGGVKKLTAELKKAGLTVTVGESLKAITEAFRAKRDAEKEQVKEQGAGGKVQATATTATTTEKPKKGQGARSKGQEKPVKKAEVVPIKVQTFDGIAYDVKSETEAQFTQYPDNPDLYVRSIKGHDLLYVCIGSKGDLDAFLLVGEKKGGVSDNIKHVAEVGILTAIADGTITKVQDYIYHAFENIDDKTGHEWLQEYKEAHAA